MRRADLRRQVRVQGELRECRARAAVARLVGPTAHRGLSPRARERETRASCRSVRENSGANFLVNSELSLGRKTMQLTKHVGPNT